MTTNERLYRVMWVEESGRHSVMLHVEDGIIFNAPQPYDEWCACELGSFIKDIIDRGGCDVKAMHVTIEEGRGWSG